MTKKSDEIKGNEGSEEEIKTVEECRVSAAATENKDTATCPFCGIESSGYIIGNLFILDEHDDPGSGDICPGSDFSVKIKLKDGEECTAICMKCKQRVKSRMTRTMSITKTHQGLNKIYCTGSGCMAIMGTEMKMEE